MNKPNVVLILADDMGYGDFGVFGDGSPHTPIIDRLVSEGICLTQHYSAAPVCAPARAALMTGRYPHRTGVIDTQDANGLDRLSVHETTLADVFRKGGYVTGLIGKWHLGAIDPEYHPNARGFDEFVGFRGGWSNYYDWRIEYNGKYRKSKGEYLTDVFTEEAVNFITRHKDERFFLHLAYNAPHFPFQAPEEDIVPFRNTGKFNEKLSTLYAMISIMDRGIGKVWDTLKKSGIEKDTMIIFTSDNGPQLNDELKRYNCNFNGSKGNVYEGGIRVPAVLRWQDQFKAGARIDEMVHFTDWFPTLAAACGINIPEGLHIDGQNVLDILKGQQRKYGQKRFWQWNRYEPVSNCNAAVRDGEWKLIRPQIKEAMALSEEDIKLDQFYKKNPEKAVKVISPSYTRQVPEPHPAQLYNLADDPCERQDRSGDNRELTEKMSQELETWFEAVEADRRANK